MTVITRQRIGVISCIVILLWMSIGIFVYKSWLSFPEENKLFNQPSPEHELESCKIGGQKLKSGFWKRIDLHKQKIPQAIKDSASAFDVMSDSVTVQGVKVHYIFAKPKEENSIPVLFLHGQSYTSETWNELGTIKLLAAAGYYPVAIDLPGFGKTEPLTNVNKVDFIDNLITELNLLKPVLVSPSMSGAYSLSYLIKHPEKLGGFVPVAPVNSNVLNTANCQDQDDSVETQVDEDCHRIQYLLKSEKPKLSCIKVPTLVVWGERDRGENSAKLCLLPESQGAEVPEGKHSAYLTNPNLWHKLLYNFLNTLNSTKAC